jgi:uncharacterized protein
MKKTCAKISKIQARNIWIAAQKLNEKKPFGLGAQAVAQAVQHLGYVQIDTINVIERCHHHILYNRIPNYKKEFLHEAQTLDKSIFEYWTHALSFVSTADYPYFMPLMKQFENNPRFWYASVTQEDEAKVLRILKKEGAISIRDIKDDVLVEKEHEWGSAKPSKKALQKGFYSGKFVVSAREGILKKYDLRDRHFGWDKKPKAASEKDYAEYIIRRALKAQGVISLDSTCYLENSMKKTVQQLFEKKIKTGELLQVDIEDCNKVTHFCRPEILNGKINKQSGLTHILSPFDPLIIQRKRLNMLFDYNHIFEAYVPPAKRKYGYFTLPVLSGHQIIAMLDLKTDRAMKKLLIQSWHWLPKQKSKSNTLLIENELERFESFQLS